MFVVVLEGELYLCVNDLVENLFCIRGMVNFVYVKCGFFVLLCYYWVDLVLWDDDFVLCYFVK